MVLDTHLNNFTTMSILYSTADNYKLLYCIKVLHDYHTIHIRIRNDAELNIEVMTVYFLYYTECKMNYHSVKSIPLAVIPIIC